MTNVDIIRAYHERTKHRLNAYARGPEYLDWDNQPDPFRLFDGAPLDSLPLSPDPVGTAAELDRAAISKLLELSMGLSAWKAFGPDRWALRCNPSSGNLHPTEAYIVSSGCAGLADGVHHYRPREHALEHRASLAPGVGNSFCLLGLTSIFWREAWKYGERAFRYVQLDVGHALGAVRYAAAVLGWQIRLLPLGDQQISELLGTARGKDFVDAEREHPDLLVQLLPDQDTPAINVPQATHWQGNANSLGGDPHLEWPVIQQAHDACPCDGSTMPGATRPAHALTIGPQPLAEMIRQRRSAQAFIGKQSLLSLAAFRDILSALLPTADTAPWDCWHLPTRLHPVFFVHRVDGIAPGLYVLPRTARATALLQSAMSDEFEWQGVEEVAGRAVLYRLASGDVRKVARALCCHQEIASASSFSLAMLAEYDDGLASGACTYRHLHWEAGLLGQVLYLWAEKVGLRGTGIGCFFDDSVHEVLGIQDTRLQSLYHFTVGNPRLDPRLETLPPYPNRK